MKVDRHYYPTGQIGANALHQVHDWAYVRRIMRAVIKGEVIPPILIDGEPNNCNMLTGTHRAAANDLLAKLGRDERIDWINLDHLEDDIRAQVEAILEDEDNWAERIDEIIDRSNDK